MSFEAGIIINISWTNLFNKNESHTNRYDISCKYHNIMIFLQECNVLEEDYIWYNSVLNKVIEIGSLRQAIKSNLYIPNMYETIENFYIGEINNVIQNIDIFTMFCIICNRSKLYRFDTDILKIIYQYLIPKSSCDVSFYQFKMMNTHELDILYMFLPDNYPVRLECNF